MHRIYRVAGIEYQGVSCCSVTLEKGWYSIYLPRVAASSSHYMLPCYVDTHECVCPNLRSPFLNLSSSWQTVGAIESAAEGAKFISVRCLCDWWFQRHVSLCKDIGFKQYFVTHCLSARVDTNHPSVSCYLSFLLLCYSLERVKGPRARCCSITRL